MKNNITELVFILDRSGSMNGMEKDTIGGFNSMIQKQKQLDGQAYVTTVLFNDYNKTIHDRIDLKEVKPLTEKDYHVSGCTALLDAIGTTINHIEKRMFQKIQLLLLLLMVMKMLANALQVKQQKN